jgi:hypothetical protein
MRILLVSVLALIVVTASGCGADCEDICKKQNACHSGHKPVDCPTQCVALNSIASNGHCKPQFDAQEDCLNGLGDQICTYAEGGCGGQQQTFFDCAASYCSRMPVPTECQIK